MATLNRSGSAAPVASRETEEILRRLAELAHWAAVDAFTQEETAQGRRAAVERAVSEYAARLPLSAKDRRATLAFLRREANETLRAVIAAGFAPDHVTGSNHRRRARTP